MAGSIMKRRLRLDCGGAILMKDPGYLDEEVRNSS